MTMFGADPNNEQAVVGAHLLADSLHCLRDLRAVFLAPPSKKGRRG